MRRLAAIALAMAAAAAPGPALAQEVPPVISPLRIEADQNGVNLVSGKTEMATPVLSVPGAPNLRFDRVQNAAPYVNGRVTGGGPEQLNTRTYSVHTGTGTSDSFQCADYECASIAGTGSTFLWNTNIYRQAGSAARYRFNLQHVLTGGPNQAMLYYASEASYPNGETITYSYQTVTPAGDPFNRTFYRPVTLTSNLGYAIAITYQSDTWGEAGWSAVAQATLTNTAVSGPVLGQLTFSGNTVTDLAGRQYSCVGCNNLLGADIEVPAGSTTLPGEGSAAVQVAAVSGAQVVGSVTRDGVAWTYGYTGLTYQTTTQGYLYSQLTVDGPNGFHNVYDVAQVGPATARRNVVTRATDSIGRQTNYSYDEYYRPVQMVLPEGNEVSVGYDPFGNIIWRRTRAKPGSGLADILETASFPTDTCLSAGTPILCYRPTWTRDGLGRQTDYAYNSLGQLIERTDPADAAGVRRRTCIAYEQVQDGPSRPSATTVRGDTAACTASGGIRTEYQYSGGTLLVTRERRIDVGTGATLDTYFTYDRAGRPTSTDGPLAGSGDATYVRYDNLGRKTWEIGPAGANGFRTARRFEYRPADDRVSLVETGSIVDATFNPASATDPGFATIFGRTDYAYDGHRNPVRETVTADGAVRGVTQNSYDDRGRLECSVVRMNPAVFGSLPASACDLGTQGSQGPDRIARNTYDAAGQLLQVQRAYRITTANGFPETLQANYATYTYSANGQRTSVTDANGNVASMTYDGFDRQIRWNFPSPTTPGQVSATDYEAYTYDAVGNRLTLRKRDGSVLTFTYDNLNRLIVKQVPERAGLAATHTRDVFYRYDLRNLPLDIRFDSLTGEGIANVYDGFGRLSSSTLTMDGIPHPLGHQYDAGGRRTRITHTDGQNFTYAFDAANRMTGIYEGTGTTWRVLDFTYNERGLPAQRNELYANGQVQYGYDVLGRLSTQTDTYAWGTTGNLTTTLGYNPASQIVQQTRSNDAYASNTAYNVNRTYAVNGLNQYTTAGGATFSYDANGNLTGDGTNTYTYDVENRLVGRSGGVTLRYDPLGRLYEVVGGSGATRFLWDGDALVAEYNSANTMTARYLHGGNPGADDPLIWYTYSPGQIHWLRADHQGSIVAVTDGNGSIQNINAYDEYGIPNAANYGRFQYTGQIWLPELGMYHYKGRIYSPTLGRMMQVDPIGYEDQVNLYAYVANDPVNHTDPDGETGVLAIFEIPAVQFGFRVNPVIGIVVVAQVIAMSQAPPRDPSNPPTLAGNAGRGGDGRRLSRGDNGGPEEPRRRVPAPPSTEHAQERRNQARAGDTHREVGDPNRIIREGRPFHDAMTGNTIYVSGGRAVVVNSRGEQVTQFRITARNVQQRIRDERWRPR